MPLVPGARVGIVVGTPGYMSPEQGIGDDPRSERAMARARRAWEAFET